MAPKTCKDWQEAKTISYTRCVKRKGVKAPQSEKRTASKYNVFVKNAFAKLKTDSQWKDKPVKEVMKHVAKLWRDEKQKPAATAPVVAKKKIVPIPKTSLAEDISKIAAKQKERFDAVLTKYENMRGGGTIALSELGGIPRDIQLARRIRERRSK